MGSELEHSASESLLHRINACDEMINCLKMEKTSISPENLNISLNVRGTLFILNPDDVSNFQSEFLSKLVDPDSNFFRPDDRVFVVDADPEYFSLFLHLARCGGSIPQSLIREKFEFLFEQADFWCIKERVETTILDERKKVENIIKDQIRCGCPPGLYELKSTIEIAQSSKIHHNNRRNDGCGRITCDICGHRDIDSRWYNDDGRTFYTSCKGCGKDIMYRSNLGWCHKCGLCKTCQPAECKANRKHPDPNYLSAEWENTAKHEVAIQPAFEKAILKYI